MGRGINGGFRPVLLCHERGRQVGHIEELPSGSYRVHVYVGTDPITRRPVYLRETAKDLVKAQIALGKLLERAQAGKEPESGATVGQLLDQYMPIADWDVSTREGFESYVRRTIRPALGHLKVRKVQRPILDTLYSRLKKCGHLTCTASRSPSTGTSPTSGLSAADRQVAGSRWRASCAWRSSPAFCRAGAPLPSVAT